MTEFLDCLNRSTPLTDKILAVTGASVAAAITLGHVQAFVGITVGVLTALAIIPRLVIGYFDMRDRIKLAEKASEDEQG